MLITLGVQPRRNLGQACAGLTLKTYDFQQIVPANSPLVFLGHIERIKGPHLAIEVARRSGRQLLIAGNVPPDQQNWYQREIEPYIDGAQVQYLGPVDDV